MIKNFETYINEDYFSKLANRKDNGERRKENEITEDFVRSFVQQGYESSVFSISFRKNDNKTFVDIDGTFVLKDDTEEIPFQFGEITGDFDCIDCRKLKSFKGCPEKVRGNFYCSHCDKLTSLKGCPQEIGRDFNFETCKRLKSLEGCPKEVGKNFYGGNCAKEFSESEITSLCNVKGKIYV